MNTFLFKKMAIVLHTDLEKRGRGERKKSGEVKYVFYLRLNRF